MNNNIKRKASFILALIVVLVVPVVFFYIFAYKPHPTLLTEEVLPIYGPKKPIERTDAKGHKKIDTIYYSIPAFKFVAHTGDTISSNYLRGKVFVADFFFSNCPGICLDMAKNLKKVQETFLDDEDLSIISYTVDPEADSVAQLYKYAIEHGIDSKKWLLLTGEKKKIYDLARYAYFVTALQGDGGPNDFIHSEKLILIDKEGRIRGYYDGTSEKEVDRLIADIKILLVSYIIPRKEQ